MTNIEKAKEIAEKTIVDASTSFLGWINEMSTDFCVWSALEMAELKDAQFKEYLENERKHYEKKYNLLKDNEFNQTEADKAWCIYHYLDAIINELFKED